ncbi:MAG: LLM class oxidoreductase [Verrucomicrobiota bacterium JB023]|nr:LLM class oxidoreductase [Verrucomicrobiota bacterium JB023]
MKAGDEQAIRGFPEVNRGYGRVFQFGRMSLGLVVPLESYPNSPVPTMERHLERVRLAEELGFSAVWIRDVPFHVPSFGDAGQTFDPFVYLGLLAGATKEIALGVASVVLPLRHPAHVAKAATTADVLSDGRLLLGVASGDRPDEYPALSMNFEDRGARFRASMEYIQRSSERFPSFENDYGRLNGQMDLLPKPARGKLPLLITGGSQQNMEWIAQNGDGWMTYPRNFTIQSQAIQHYRKLSRAAGLGEKPVMQPFHIDLVDDPTASPRPIHLGFRLGMNSLRDYLREVASLGVNHVALNLRFNQNNAEDTMRRLAEEILPEFKIN